MATGNFRAAFSPQLGHTIPKSGAHIGTQVTLIPPLSGARPTALSVKSEKVGRLEASNHNGFKDSAPLAPLAPLKNKGVRIIAEMMLQDLNCIFE
ncbi:hypothetical protein [Nitrosomonas supralitoralis]|uniref:Uncharacterized protein n=1 Tax=Nitrosomonas supralitoralis TaxID=2116706 RepID=A0A2P7NYJ7_9PROT|nr:hypothetical protein [Nitrosomonas supralitoralis]PSJ18524.1 hypothetical protein C7H79_02780 [Nitrosomonas supralitoralis]